MKVRGHYNKMANGQVFDPQRLTAASLTLPLGKIVRVTNKKTGLSVDVEITDRGPFVKGRILDLAQAAAKKIECNGICPVQITEVPVSEGDPAS
jgi:rare lipoprotein A